MLGVKPTPGLTSAVRAVSRRLGSEAHLSSITDDTEAKGRTMGHEPSLDELRAEASHAAARLALYRRKVLLGHGDPRVLASRERVSQGAAERLRRAQDRATSKPPPGP